MVLDLRLTTYLYSGCYGKLPHSGAHFTKLQSQYVWECRTAKNSLTWHLASMLLMRLWGLHGDQKLVLELLAKLLRPHILIRYFTGCAVYS